jgi:hypothetical protein
MFAFCWEVFIANTRSAQRDLMLLFVKTEIRKAKISFNGGFNLDFLPSHRKAINLIFLI